LTGSERVLPRPRQSRPAVVRRCAAVSESPPSPPPEPPPPPVAAAEHFAADGWARRFVDGADRAAQRRQCTFGERLQWAAPRVDGTKAGARRLPRRGYSLRVGQPPTGLPHDSLRLGGRRRFALGASARSFPCHRAATAMISTPPGMAAIGKYDRIRPERLLDLSQGVARRRGDEFPDVHALCLQ
jgi:hypothetical protein